MSALLPAALADHALLVSAGLLAAAALAVPARALLRRDPITCYRLLFALLVGAVAVVPLQWLVAGRAAPLAAPLRDWLRARARPEATRPELDRTTPFPGDMPEGTFLVDAGSGPRRPRAAAPRDELASESTELGSAPDGARANDAAPPEAYLAGGLRLREERPRAAWTDLLSNHRAELATGAALLWLAGFAVVAGRRLLRVARTHRLIARARDVSDPDVRAIWRRVARDSRVADRIRLVESAAVASPACAGLVRRVVIVPAGVSAPAVATDPGVLEWALRHELVHLERGDAWAALFQSAVTALLWFHPAAWWLSAEIGRWRELSCDQQVVEGSGRRRSYALALLEYAACASRDFPAIDADPHSAGVRHALLHWSRSPSQIRRRIEMLTVDPASLPRARRWLGALVAGCAFAVPVVAQVAGAATLLPPRPAQDAPAPVAATPAAAPVSTPAPSPVARPFADARPAVAPPIPADDAKPAASAPAPRARRSVTVPAGLALPPQDAPKPAPRRAAVRVADGDDEEEVEDADECCAGEACEDDDCDEAAAGRIADEVAQRMRSAHRQIEQAVRQAQRSSMTHQRDLQREFDKVSQQADRQKRKSEQQLVALKKRLADADDDDRREKIQSELAALQQSSLDEQAECEARCVDLKQGLAALQDVDFEACQESLGALQLASAVDAQEIQRAIQEGMAAQQSLASLQALGYVEEDGDAQDGDDRKRKHARDVHALVERALAQSREATERACARAAEAAAHARERGALTKEQQQQVERAVAKARKINVDEIQKKVAVELDRAKAGKAKKAGLRPGGKVADPAGEPPPEMPRKARSLRPPNVPVPADPPADAAPRGRFAPAGDHEAMLKQRIEMLEQQIDALRAELESLRGQQPATPPARHGRALR